MPISPDLAALYPADWPEISKRIRFGRADGRCEQCRRPHGWSIYQAADGRWWDAADGIWRDDRGQRADRPSDLPRLTQVVLTTAHLAHDPTLNDDTDLAALCTRCHLDHDRDHHRATRRRHVREQFALGDLFAAS